MDLSATIAPSLELAASDRIVVGVVAAVALAALAVGFVLLREVLAAGQGTAKMQEIGRAVQEGRGPADVQRPHGEARHGAGRRRGLRRRLSA